MGLSDRGKRTNSFSMELSGCAVDFQHLIIGNAFPSCSDRAKADQNKQLYTMHHAPVQRLPASSTPARGCLVQRSSDPHGEKGPSSLALREILK